MSRLSVPVTKADHRIGPDDARVTLVEYGDYECPHCGTAHPIVQELIRLMGPRLRFVFRNFPLTQIHPHAEHAAESAESADVEGKFWPMHDMLFENQDDLSDPAILTYAEAIGLDVERVAQELADGTHEAKVRADFQSGVRSGVNGTPTFFVNGVRYDGQWDLTSLLRAVEAAATAEVA